MFYNQDSRAAVEILSRQLANARGSSVRPIKEQLILNNTLSLARQEELLRWWNLSIESSGDPPYEPISVYASCTLPDLRSAEKALELLARELHTCPARCPKQFRQWCYRQIDKVAAKHSGKGRSEKHVRKGTKPFRCEQHGDVCFIPVNDAKGQQHIWKVPADRRKDAELLWPVHIRWYSDGKPYLSRKVRTPDGQKNVAIHRLFLGLSAVRHEVSDNLEVETRDGSWLNYCNGNLSLRASSDALDHATAGLETVEYEPVKAFERKTGWNTSWYAHERNVSSWLYPVLPSGMNEIGEAELLPNLGY